MEGEPLGTRSRALSKPWPFPSDCFRPWSRRLGASVVCDRAWEICRYRWHYGTGPSYTMSFPECDRARPEIVDRDVP